MSANRKAFEFLVVSLLNHLYDRFPEQEDIGGGVYCVEAACSPGLNDEVREAVPRVFSDTIEWLEAEGFIRTSNNHRMLDGSPGVVTGAVLTMKGLTLVGYTFDPSAGDRSTLADTAKDIVKSGASDAAAAWIKRLLNMALEFGMDVAGS